MTAITGLAAATAADEADATGRAPATASVTAGAEIARMSEAEVDQMLVERVQKGDRRAFDLLINKYQHRIVSLVGRYVNDPADAMDVAQDAFIKAYRAIGRFRGDSAFYTWLYRIAINTAKNWLVARKRRPPATDIDAADAEQYDIESRLKEQGTPENEVLREEIKRVVFDTIAELPDDLRTAIMLREMEGMSYEDIAATMDCPIGTVRSRIFRAREAIDTQLKPLLEGVEIVIFLGTWCIDSQRQVPKFVKILEESGYPTEEIHVVYMTRDKATPQKYEEGLDITNVPTFIFYRNGKEMNRIVEFPIEDLESDMLKILKGEPYKHAFAWD